MLMPYPELDVLLANNDQMAATSSSPTAVAMAASSSRAATSHLLTRPISYSPLHLSQKLGSRITLTRET